MAITACAGTLLSIAAGVQETPPPQWTQWGGPSADFTVRDAPALVEDWGEAGPKTLWKRELGAGYSSILFLEDQLYTVYRDGDEDVVVALDADTGDTIWEAAASTERYPDMVPHYGEGPNSTPLILGDRLVHSGVAGVLRCLDLESGEPLWKVDLHAEYGRQARQEEYGYSGIHLRHEGMLLVLVGGDRHGVVALDPADGSLIWGSEPFRVSYAPPVMLSIHGRLQMVLFTPTEVLALDPADGQVIWRSPVRCHTENNLTTAILCEDDQLWVASQFAGATRLLRLHDRDGRIEPERVWFTNRVQQCHWNSIRLGDHVYGSIGSVGGSQFAAVNWRTGEIAWQERGFHAAQCIHADGKILFLDEHGMLAIVSPSPEELRVLAQHQVGQRVCWSVPTLIGSTLYLRDTQHIMALDLARDSYR